MMRLNPYEPSGTVSVPQVDGAKANKRVGSFIIIQCLSFVITFVVIAIAISCYEVGVGAVFFSAFRTIRLAGMAILLWLPHALVALSSRQIRCAGASLSGVVGATGLLFGIYATEWVLRNWVTSSLSGFLFLALGLLISLAAVAVLGHFLGRSESTKREGFSQN